MNDDRPRTDHDQAPAATGRRVVVLDFCGHPFQVQLGRELAGRGHTVLHLYCPDVPSGRGNMSTDPALPSLSIAAVTIGQPFQRYDFVRRSAQERRFGQIAADRVRDFAPDVVLLSNVPLIAATVLRTRFAATGIPYVLWHQDVASLAIADAFTEKLGVAGRPFGRVARRVESALAAGAAQLVAISESFRHEYDSWGIHSDVVTVVPNWAPIDELPTAPRDNAWARAHDLVGRTVFAYTGTLGLKHNPGLLLGIARHLRDAEPDARLVVVSEGTGREWLEERKTEEGIEQLVLLDYQPYEQMHEVTGAADVLVAILEPDAGAFSVPSKVLSYLCAGRPVLGLMPTDNLAARTIVEAGAGWVSAPDEQTVIPALQAALADPTVREACGAAARRYAERTFPIAAIGDRFEAVLDAATDGRPTVRGGPLTSGRLPRPRTSSDAKKVTSAGRTP